jgi:4'-phosphopantetheinyl transferase EntD
MRLGCVSSTIAVGESGMPVWPPGFIGTISHSRALCVAHVGRARDLVGMGVDIEPDDPLPGDLVARICRPDENSGRADRTALLRFVAKEAFYKAYFPETRSFLDFHDVRVDLDLSHETFAVRIVAPNKPALAERRSFTGRFTRLAGHLVGVLWITM